MRHTPIKPTYSAADASQFKASHASPDEVRAALAQFSDIVDFGKVGVGVGVLNPLHIYYNVY
jgi:hypothetical protein